MSVFSVDEFNSLTDVQDEMLIPEFFQTSAPVDVDTFYDASPGQAVLHPSTVSHRFGQSSMMGHPGAVGSLPQPLTRRPLVGSASGSASYPSSVYSSSGSKYSVKRHRRDVRRLEPYERILDMPDTAPTSSSLVGGVLALVQAQPQSYPTCPPPYIIEGAQQGPGISVEAPLLPIPDPGLGPAEEVFDPLLFDQFVQGPAPPPPPAPLPLAMSNPPPPPGMMMPPHPQYHRSRPPDDYYSLDPVDVGLAAAVAAATARKMMMMRQQALHARTQGYAPRQVGVPQGGLPYDDLFNGLPFGTNLNEFLAQEKANILRAAGEAMIAAADGASTGTRSTRADSPSLSVGSATTASSGGVPSPAIPDEDRMDVTIGSLDNDPEAPAVRMVEEIERVVVHVGEKKSFRLYRGLIYYRKSTVRVRVVCQRPLRFDGLQVFCHLEYKSFRTSAKGESETSVWLPCETPAHVTNSATGHGGPGGKRKKGVYVEYHFPKTGNEIEIQYCVTYNVKEMCHNTGKNFIRIHFTIYFSSDEMQEVAIPMIWDTHGKTTETPIRVQQLIAVADRPFPKLYYRVTNDSEALPLTRYVQGIEPLHISQNFTPNGRTKPPVRPLPPTPSSTATAAPAPAPVRSVHAEMLECLARSAGLPPRYLMQQLPGGNRPVVLLGLFNGIDERSFPTQMARHVRLIRAVPRGGQGSYVDTKSTALAHMMCSMARKDGSGFVLLYDLNRKNVASSDVVDAFVFAHSQARSLVGRGANVVVVAPWGSTFSAGDTTLERVIDALSLLPNVMVLTSAGNESQWLNGNALPVYPRCVPLTKLVVRVGALCPDNVTPQLSSNWGSDCWVVGASTSVATVHCALLCSYLWTLLPTASGAEFLARFLSGACSVVDGCRRVVNCAMRVVSAKRPRTSASVPSLAVLMTQLDQANGPPPASPVVLEVPRGSGFPILEAPVDGEAPAPKRRRLDPSLRGPASLSETLSSFPTLPSKLSLMLDIVRQLAALPATTLLGLTPQTIRVRPSASPSPFLSFPPPLASKIDFLFSIFARHDVDLRFEDGVIPSRDLPVALETFFCRRDFRVPEDVLSEDNVSLDDFRGLLARMMFPASYDVEFATLEQSSGRSLTESLGALFADVLDGRRDSIVMPIVQGFVEGRFQSLEEISAHFAEALNQIFLRHQSLLERYCRDVTQEMSLLERSEVFVPLRLSELVTEAPDSPKTERSETDLLGDDRNVVITGHAGSGKSGLLHRLAARAANEILRDGFSPDTLLPVFIPLFPFVTSEKLLPAYVEGYCQGRYRFLRYLLHPPTEATPHRSALVLFDGLDEVSYLGDGSGLRGLNLTIGKRNIVTSRERYPNLNNFSALQLLPLELPQQKALIVAELKSLVGPAPTVVNLDGADEIETEGEGEEAVSFADLRTALFEMVNQSAFRPFVRIPALLRVLISSVVEDPSSRSGASSFHLCARLLKYLLNTYQQKKLSERNDLDRVQQLLTRLDDPLTLEYLEKFAFTIQNQRVSQFSCCFCEQRDMARFGSVLQVINELMSMSCLPLFVKLDGGVFAFANNGLQAHLVSRYVIKAIKHDLKSAARSSTLRWALMRQSVFHDVFQARVQYMVGEMWFVGVLMQLASGLETADFVRLIQYLYPTNPDLCNLMLYERKTSERTQLLGAKEFRGYTFRDEVTITVDDSHDLSLLNAPSVPHALSIASSLNENLRVSIRMAPGLSYRSDAPVRVSRDNLSFEGGENTVLVCDSIVIDGLNLRFQGLRITSSTEGVQTVVEGTQGEQSFPNCVFE